MLLFIYRKRPSRAAQILQDLLRLDPTGRLLLRAINLPMRLSPAHIQEETAGQTPPDTTPTLQPGATTQPQAQTKPLRTKWEQAQNLAGSATRIIQSYVQAAASPDKAQATQAKSPLPIAPADDVQRVTDALVGRVFNDFEYVLSLVLLSTLFALGWYYVLYPEHSLGLAHLAQSGAGVIELANYLVTNITPLTIGFMGAYFYVLQMLVRRYLADDLYPAAFLQGAQRLVIVFILSMALTVALPLLQPTPAQAAATPPLAMPTATATATATATISAAATLSVTMRVTATPSPTATEVPNSGALPVLEIEQSNRATSLPGGVITSTDTSTPQEIPAIRTSATATPTPSPSLTATPTATSASVVSSIVNIATATPTPGGNLPSSSTIQLVAYTPWLGTPLAALTLPLPLPSGDIWSLVLLLAAFFAGIFPNRGLTWLREALNRGSNGLIRVPSLEERAPLTRLDGLSVWTEARLLEEGLSNVESLATADFELLVLNTNFSTAQLIDWVDQALLYVHAGRSGEGIAPLRSAGKRTASDLLEAVSKKSLKSLLCDCANPSCEISDWFDGNKAGELAKAIAVNQIAGPSPDGSGASQADTNGQTGAVTGTAQSRKSGKRPYHLTEAVLREICTGIWSDQNLLYVLNFRAGPQQVCSPPTTVPVAASAPAAAVPVP